MHQRGHLKPSCTRVPSIFHDELQVMLYSELISSLHVLWSRGVDTNDGHAPLAAWHTERRVEEAGVNVKHVCLEV